jgi:hypothetical protein
MNVRVRTGSKRRIRADLRRRCRASRANVRSVPGLHVNLIAVRDAPQAMRLIVQEARMPVLRRDVVTRMKPVAGRSGSRVMATVRNDLRDRADLLVVRASSRDARAGSIASPRVAVIPSVVSAKVVSAASLLVVAVAILNGGKALAATVASLQGEVTRTGASVRVVLAIVRLPVLGTAASLTAPKVILPADRAMADRGPVVFAAGRVASPVTDVRKTIAVSVGLTARGGTLIGAVVATMPAAASRSRVRACFLPRPRRD